MTQHSKAIGALILSPVILVIGLLFLIAGMGPTFSGSGGYSVDYTQLAVCVALVTVLAFAFGALRYSMPAGLSLAAATLHDQLIALALTAIVGAVVPQMHLMPVMVVMACVFTFAHSLPILRAASELRAGNSLRDMTHEAVASLAVKQTYQQRLVTAGVALVLLAAGAIGGGLQLAGWLVPVLAGLVASLLSAHALTPLVWASAPRKSAVRRTSR